MVGNSVSNDDDAFKFFLVGLVEVAERISAPEESFCAFVSEIVRQPVYICPSAKHDAPGNRVGLEGHARMDLVSSGNAACEETDEEVFNQSLKSCDRSQKNTFVEQAGISARDVSARAEAFDLGPCAIERAEPRRISVRKCS